jgi:hypothetical protein
MFTKKSNVVDEDGHNLLTCDLFTEAELDFATDADIRDTIRRLAAHKLTDTPGDFELRETAFGFNHEPHGLLMDPALDAIVDPVSHYAHDWMHAMVVNGVFNTIVFLLCMDISNAGMHDIWGRFHAYVKLWCWPARAGNGSKHYSDIFNPKRATSSKKAKHLKCSASDCLSIYAVMAFYIQVVVIPSGLCRAACLAFLGCADLLDMLMCVNLGFVTEDMLREAVHKLLERCVQAGWTDYMHMKFHWMLHFASELTNFGCMLSCFVHERRHKLVKRYASLLLNTSAYERSVLSEVICQHLADLAEPDSYTDKVGLVGSHAAKQTMISFLSDALVMPLTPDIVHTSYRAQIQSSICNKGDVVLVQSTHDAAEMLAGEIWFHAEVDGICMSLISMWYARDDDGWVAPFVVEFWKKTPNPILTPTDDILAVCIWKMSGEYVQTLLPYQFRSRRGERRR